MIRKIVAVSIASAALCLGMSVPAYADSATVSGTGDIEKMTAKNGTDAVVVKVFGPGGKCDVRSVSATLKGSDGVTYEATGACYPGGEWIFSLQKGEKLLSCSADRLAYNTTGGFWRFYVPRSCLPRLTNKIKVSSEMVYGPTPGEAGPTRLIARG